MKAPLCLVLHAAVSHTSTGSYCTVDLVPRYLHVDLGQVHVVDVM